MGDEVHNRNAAASGLLFKRLAPALLALRRAARAASRRALEFIAGNDHFFLNLSMAACKAMLDAAHGVPGSSMVTAMARNGVNFGIRAERHRRPLVHGAGNPSSTACTSPATSSPTPPPTSATARSPRPRASAASPWPRRRRSCSSSAARPPTRSPTRRAMRHITLGRNPAFTLPAAQLRRHARRHRRAPGASTRGILPIINTGIAHREAGVGQIGAGITRAPLACFAQAVAALARRSSAEGASVTDGKLAVVAVGGNALIIDAEHESIPDQYDAVARTVALRRRHGRGGLERRAHARQRPAGRLHPAPLRARRSARSPPVPDGLRRRRHAGRDRLHVRSARSTTSSGAAASRDRSSRSSPRRVVDRDDPAFANPTKPIGSFMDEATAQALAAQQLGWTVTRGRRARLAARGAVAAAAARSSSSTTIRIARRATAIVVVACGGGGIPVIEDARRRPRRASRR